MKPLLKKNIGKILKVLRDLQNENLNIDPDMERPLKLQRELHDIFSGYQEMYKQLKKSAKITYFARKENSMTDVQL